MVEALEYRSLTPKELQYVSKLYDGTQPEFISIGPKGYFVPKKYLEFASEIYNMELREGDIFVTSIPRSGTTWTQEMVWLIANDLDYEKAAAAPLKQRYKSLELAMFFDDSAKQLTMDHATDEEGAQKVLNMLSTPGPQVLSAVPSPRFVKSHLPMSLLPPKILDTAKVIHVARDPRDVAVSYYHLSRMLRVFKFTGIFKDMWQAFTKDLYPHLPYFEFVKEAWAMRHHPNMLFLFYEDLSKDLPSAVRRVADFLGKEITPDQIERLCDHLSFDNFKNNKSVNYDEGADCGILAPGEKFIRNGKTGSWREYFDEEMAREAEQWIADNLRDSDLRFPSMGQFE